MEVTIHLTPGWYDCLVENVEKGTEAEIALQRATRVKTTRPVVSFIWVVSCDEDQARALCRASLRYCPDATGEIRTAMAQAGGKPFD